MLTRDEKEILDALREHMDAEQREMFDEMSDDEKKALVKEAKKEMAKEMNRHAGSSGECAGCLERVRDIRDCPWKETIFDDGRYPGAFLLKLILKMLFFWV